MHDKYAANILLSGQNAPGFQAKTTHGNLNFPEDHQGKWVVLFTIPKDFHPDLFLDPEFIEILNEFECNNVQLIGICTGSIYRYIYLNSQLKTLEQKGETVAVKRIPIIEDVERIVARKYCMAETCSELKSSESAVLVDPSGRIRCVQNYSVSTWKNLREVSLILIALQKAQEETKTVVNE